MKRVFSTSKVKEKRSRQSYVMYSVSASCQIHLTSIGVGNNAQNSEVFGTRGDETASCGARSYDLITAWKKRRHVQALHRV